jgi:telomerase reverse transcriptase
VYRLILLQIVDFVIWSLFQRNGGTSHRPSHLLCYGYQKSPLQALQDPTDATTTIIPGVISLHANESVTKFKCEPWTEILSLVGSRGDVVLRNMLLDCGVFVRIDQGKDNLHQICGVPVSEFLKDRKMLEQQSKPTRTAPTGQAEKGSCVPRSLGTIVFVRSRILYARPSLNAQGGVRFGMKHMHVLNRYRDLNDSKQSVHIMKYMFPWQFGLHNIFTGIVDKTETAQEFKDYTLREHEIKYKERQTVGKVGANRAKGPKIPKRLRGEAFMMVEEVRKRHSRCSYTQLLRHHCPVHRNEYCAPSLSAAAESQQSLGHFKTQLSSSNSTLALTAGQQEVLGRANAGDSILTYATPSSHVSAFCRAVIRTVLPGNALGKGADGGHNLVILLGQVDRFVRMRKYESLSLHEVFQNLRINCISWLGPPTVSLKAKLSQSDRTKRMEVFLELLYYIFDSILVPLIRSHFYVTESNVHRNHLFYFRHDVWRIVSEPSLTDLRFTMFQGLPARDLREARHSRLLGHSQVRLLPKEIGARPIINLRRRLMVNKNGKQVASQNVNSRLMPCFATLNYERSLQPQKLGAALFSIAEAHQRLRNFRQVVSGSTKRLYFVKMDVKSCFDTIPQDGVVQMVQGLLSEHRYQIGKHAELKPTDGRWSTSGLERPLASFPHSARPTKTPPGLSDSMLSQLAQKRSRTVFVDLWDSRSWEARSLLKLLQEHVQRNVVTIERRFFRQKQGIPQGSVLSSLLCNFFYGAFENSCLGFLDPGESLLLRLIDDFLLITTNQDHARRFTRVMVDGNSTYGIAVNPKKSLANFEVNINGFKVPRLHGSEIFPYCGMAINVNNLEISKFRENKDPKVSNGLTIELSRRQGLKFNRKVLDSLKIQMTAMLLDTDLSTRYCVSSNLYENFMEVAMKMYRYIRGLPKTKRPRESMVIEVWKDLVNLAVKMTHGKRSTKTIDEYECAVSKTQVTWLAAAAFHHVMEKKQTGYKKVLHWVQETMERCQAGMKMNTGQLTELRDQGDRVFQRYRY